MYPGGSSSEIFNNTPKRYQNLILWAWLRIHLQKMFIFYPGVRDSLLRMQKIVRNR